jgi:outer membrane protein assembly factor BamB
MSGDAWFRWRWRWQGPADAALPKLPAGDLKTARDATIRPGDFAQFLGPNRDAVVHGIYLDHDWAAHPPLQKWRQPIGAGWGAFTVAGDLAFTQEQRGADELIVARDRDTGDPVWSHGNTVRFSEAMGGDGPRATPTIADGKVYALGATGVLDCLEASTGELLWTRDTLAESHERNLQWGKSCSPLVIDDLRLVVVSLGDGAAGSLAAYDVASGERKWVAGHDMASYASPMLATLAGKRQVVMVNQMSVTGHDPVDGKILWEYAWQTAPAKASQPPVLSGDNLLLTAGYGVPGVLIHVKRDGDKWTTEELYTTNHMRTKFTTPVVRDHFAYGLDDGALTCIDLEDEGRLVWQVGAPHRPDRYEHGQVLLVEDVLIVQAEAGEIVLVEANPSGFHKLGSLSAFKSKTWNNPALAGNRLFVRNDQEAACYDLATVEKPKGR